ADVIVRTVDALPATDGVVVATTTSSHGDVIDQVLPLGVPVFVEKPICPDPVAAARLAAAGDGRLFVMDKWRYHPGVELLAQLARTGRLGDVRGLRPVPARCGPTHHHLHRIPTPP